jgi:hypothetical protein
MSIYAAFKPTQIADQQMCALESGSSEEYTKFSAPLEQAFKDIADWANLTVGGRCVGQWGEFILIEIPIDKTVEVSQFIKKFEYTSKVNFSIGIGITTFEAYKAMCVSEHYDGDRIVMYHEGIENDLLEKAGPADSLHSSHDIDLPNLELDDEEKHSEHSEQNQAKEATVKQKIIQTLMMVKEKAPMIAKLKEIDPSAFKAVKSLVDAMIQMATSNEVHKNENQMDESSSESSEGSQDLEKEEPVGRSKKGKVKSATKDLVSGAVTGTHWHQVNAGAVLGPNANHAVSATKPNSD